jgi:hypothetical protein
MTLTTHSARITAPVPYLGAGGRQRHIPVGPCLVESAGSRAVDIVWGLSGQSSAELRAEDVEAARSQGKLVLLD